MILRIFHHFFWHFYKGILRFLCILLDEEGEKLSFLKNEPPEATLNLSTRISNCEIDMGIFFNQIYRCSHKSKRPRECSSQQFWNTNKSWDFFLQRSNDCGMHLYGGWELCRVVWNRSRRRWWWYSVCIKPMDSLSYTENPRGKTHL